MHSGNERTISHSAEIRALNLRLNVLISCLPDEVKDQFTALCKDIRNISNLPKGRADYIKKRLKEAESL